MFGEIFLKKHIKNNWLRVNIQYLPLGFIVGTLLNLFFLFVGNNNYRQWKSVVITYIFSILITSCITNISIANAYFNKKQYKSPVVNLSIYLLLVFLGVLIGSEIGFLFLSWIYDRSFAEINNWGNLKFNFFIGFLVGMILYIYDLQRDNYNLKLKDQDLQLSKLNELKTQADLKTLQARINPHFLYNSLNSIASLIHEEPDKAEDMTIKLSRLFRYSINTQEANWATVKEELEIVRTYLEIERVRFGNRIAFDAHADESIINSMIPRFLLQPLIENSLKHGLKDKNADGKLAVSIHDKNNYIEICVQDNGTPFPSEMTAGYGLQSTYDKLNLLCKGAYKVRIINDDEKKIVIELPKQNIT